MLKSTCFLALSLLLSTRIACAAPILYQNGTLDPSLIGSWDITNSTFSNSFVLGTAAQLGGVDFGTLIFGPGTVATIDWTISSASLGTGTVFGGGTASVSSVLEGVSSPFSVYRSSFALPALTLAAGNYWLTLGNASGAATGWLWAGGTPTSTVDPTPFGQGSPSNFFAILGPAPELDRARSQTPLLFAGLALLTMGSRRSGKDLVQ